MNTTENNKLIAEFMGFENYMDDLQQENRMINERDYHSSWDWLMPVIEKIAQIDGVKFSLLSVCGSYKAIIYAPKLSDTIGGGWPQESLIEATYKAVIEFIKWYNENKEA